jgi:hypothetical protein
VLRRRERSASTGTATSAQVREQVPAA